MRGIVSHLVQSANLTCLGARRQGPGMQYRIEEPSDADAAGVLKDVLVWLANDREMQRDRERLVKVCCAPQLPVSIQGAPSTCESHDKRLDTYRPERTAKWACELGYARMCATRAKHKRRWVPTPPRWG